jgi:hypothetical protein
MKWNNPANKRLKGLTKADPNPIMFNLNDADDNAVAKKATYQNPFTRVDPFSRQLVDVS